MMWSLNCLSLGRARRLMGGSAAKLMCRETELVDPNLNRFRMHQDVEIRPGSMRCSLLQFSGDLFGVLLMPLEYLETGLQQTLEFGIACGRGAVAICVGIIVRRSPAV
jgi:hypothetical protein